MYSLAVYTMGRRTLHVVRWVNACYIAQLSFTFEK